MFYQFIQPSVFLSRYIQHYWVLEIDEAEGEVMERVIPTGHIELMFHYRKPFVVKDESQNNAKTQPVSVLSGISSGYFDVAAVGNSGAITVVFLPFGASHFFRFPLSEIENQSIDLRAALGEKVGPVEEMLANARDTSERVKIVEDFLLRNFSPLGTYDLNLLQAAVGLIEQSEAGIQAAELAKRLYVSSKSLERKFSAQLGKTPKQYLKIMRFQYAVKKLSAMDGQALTDLAYQCGYFDQAHFIRDFKLFSGLTPGEFRQRYGAGASDE